VTEDTIIALSTVPGRSAIAVVRISGSASRRVAEHFGCSGLVPRRAKRVTIADEAGPIDDALALWFAGPHSYTGEDILELHCHGSPAVARRILASACGLNGVRLAEPGEFTRRAMDAGKLDLLAAEALGDLIDSDTERQRRQAVRALGGGLRNATDRLRSSLVDAAALLAAALDFNEEDDVPPEVLEHLRGDLRSISAELNRFLSLAQGATLVRNGIRIALLGPPNAGKSSLLNALAGKDAAIVSPHAGTTRDRIEVSLDWNGYLVTLIDTAGLRASDDEVELLGMERSAEAAREADIVLWISADGIDGQPEGFDERQMIRVRSKQDQHMHAPCEGWVPASVVADEGLTALRRMLSVRIEELVGQEEPVFVARERQVRCLKNASSACDRALMLGDDHPELLAEELRQALQALDELLGHVGVEAILDAVFSRFCIGK
jgi:tRNA modification GTPase